MSNHVRVAPAAMLAVALAFLNASLTFVNVWPTLFVRGSMALSIEAACGVLAVVLMRRWTGGPSRVTLRALAAIWVVLVIGRYTDVTVRSLYGRDINVYWDLRHMPNVGAMLAYVAEPWVVVGIVAGAILLPLLLYAPLRWALGRISDAATDPVSRRALLVLAGGAIVVAAAQRIDARVPKVPQFAEPVAPVYAHQIEQFAYELSGAGERSLPPAPPVRSSLAAVAGADVFLMFIESYGAVSWDHPAFAHMLAPGRERLESAIRGTGRRVASGFVESTTFGGESWLAHISLLSGTAVRDQDTNVRLMAQKRDTFVTAFARHGYHTVAVMPGLQRDWPEGAFYGFDEIYGAERLDYHGPPFGWWDITDQFAIARMDALAIAPSRRPPAFVFFPTISTHTPFTPTPPYQPDWRRVLTTTPYDPADLDRAWSQAPDWLDLGPGYAQSLDYVHATLGGYLRLRADRDVVMILVGDHQPPAAVSGEGASWEVPVHVIASRPAVIDRLLRDGFREGLAPGRPTIGRIDELLPILLAAFD